MKKKNYTSGFTLISFIIAVAIVAFSLMSIYVILGFLGIFTLAKETVCQSNRRILKSVYQIYNVVEGKKVEDYTTGVGFLISGGYMTSHQAENASISKMVWRIYENGSVDVFCNSSDAQISTYVYKSSFYAKDNVQILKGSWKIGNGVLIPVTVGENRALFGGTDGTDYTIEINAAYLGGNAKHSGYGIYYRASKNVNISGYVFQFDPGKGNLFILRKVTNGQESGIIKQVSMIDSMGEKFDITKAHDVKIVLTGQNQVISIDGVEILSFSDMKYSSGYVGVRSWNDSIVNFFEVKVTKK